MERYCLLNVFIELVCVTILGIDKEDEMKSPLTFALFVTTYVVLSSYLAL